MVASRNFMRILLPRISLGIYIICKFDYRYEWVKGIQQKLVTHPFICLVFFLDYLQFSELKGNYSSQSKSEKKSQELNDCDFVNLNKEDIQYLPSS